MENSGKRGSYKIRGDGPKSVSVFPLGKLGRQKNEASIQDAMVTGISPGTSCQATMSRPVGTAVDGPLFWP